MDHPEARKGQRTARKPMILGAVRRGTEGNATTASARGAREPLLQQYSSENHSWEYDERNDNTHYMSAARSAPSSNAGYRPISTKTSIPSAGSWRRSSSRLSFATSGSTTARSQHSTTAITLPSSQFSSQHASVSAQTHTTQTRNDSSDESKGSLTHSNTNHDQQKGLDEDADAHVGLAKQQFEDNEGFDENTWIDSRGWQGEDINVISSTGEFEGDGSFLDSDSAAADIHQEDLDLGLNDDEEDEEGDYKESQDTFLRSDPLQEQGLEQYYDIQADVEQNALFDDGPFSVSRSSPGSKNRGVDDEDGDLTLAALDDLYYEGNAEEEDDEKEELDDYYDNDDHANNNSEGKDVEEEEGDDDDSNDPHVMMATTSLSSPAPRREAINEQQAKEGTKRPKGKVPRDDNASQIAAMKSSPQPPPLPPLPSLLPINKKNNSLVGADTATQTMIQTRKKSASTKTTTATVKATRTTSPRSKAVVVKTTAKPIPSKTMGAPAPAPRPPSSVVDKPKSAGVSVKTPPSTTQNNIVISKPSYSNSSLLSAVAGNGEARNRRASTRRGGVLPGYGGETLHPNPSNNNTNTSVATKTATTQPPPSKKGSSTVTATATTMPKIKPSFLRRTLKELKSTIPLGSMHSGEGRQRRKHAHPYQLHH